MFDPPGCPPERDHFLKPLCVDEDNAPIGGARIRIEGSLVAREGDAADIDTGRQGLGIAVVHPESSAALVLKDVTVGARVERDLIGRILGHGLDLGDAHNGNNIARGGLEPISRYPGANAWNNERCPDGNNDHDNDQLDEGQSFLIHSFSPFLPKTELPVDGVLRNGYAKNKNILYLTEIKKDLMLLARRQKNHPPKIVTRGLTFFHSIHDSLGLHRKVEKKGQAQGLPCSTAKVPSSLSEHLTPGFDVCCCPTLEPLTGN
jgi:hypothetical protein